MRFDLKILEHQFILQKNNLLENLRGIEKKKRTQLSSIMKELERYKKREAVLKKLEVSVSDHLKQINSKVHLLKNQDENDRKRVAMLFGEIKELKNAIPRIEGRMKRITPVRFKIDEQEKTLTKNLSELLSKISALENMKNKKQHELKILLEKENMLRQGRIYWNVPTKSTNSRHAEKRKSRSKNKTSFLKMILGK